MRKRLPLIKLYTILGLSMLITLPAMADSQFSGLFEKKKGLFKGRVTGAWTISQSEDVWTLRTGEDFKAKKAPDLKFFLSKKSAGDINGKNATEEAILIEQIDQFKGAFEVSLPAGVNPNDYKSLVLHCEQYRKLWGASPLVK